MSIAADLAEWATSFEPSAADIELADRSLVDTAAVAIAAREHPLTRVVIEQMTTAGAWATAAHVLDFDDLHIPSTTHISTVCVPAVLAAGGGAREYIAAAGVMARLGTALGWRHYAAGWHATTTSGAIAAAVATGLSRGLSKAQLETAISLAIPASGGVRAAFGTDAKSIQVGQAVEAGARAAGLAASNVSADPKAVESWMRLVEGDPESLRVDQTEAVPGGLAIKLFPACYALQRPIGAVRQAIGETVQAEDVAAIRVRTPESTVAPLLHHRPKTGFEGKFSLEYSITTALIDDHQGFDAFDDPAVQRAEAQRLIELVETELLPGGNGLLDGRVEVEIDLVDGRTVRGNLADPPGSPAEPAAPEVFQRKIEDCLRGSGATASELTWENAAGVLRARLPRKAEV